MRIARRGFEIETSGDGITWITEPHAERMVRCNIWHVRGGERDLQRDEDQGGLNVVSKCRKDGVLQSAAR